MSSLLAGIRIVSKNNSSNPNNLPQQRPSLQHDSKNRVEWDAVELASGDFASSSKSNATNTPERPQTPEGAYTNGKQNVPTLSELEASPPPSPGQYEAARVLQSWSYPSMSKWRVLSACLVYLGNGMNDSAPGALLPYIESFYHIGYAIVSMIWIANAAGFILAAFFTDLISSRLGRARSLMLSELCMIAAYVVVACTPPFAAVVVAYFVVGFGMALNLAMNNVYCANLANSTVILGAAHGSYGIGGIIAPILATSLVASGVRWSRFYLVVLGVRLVCLAFGGWAFWNYEKEGNVQFANSLQPVHSRTSATTTAAGETSKLKSLGRALRNRTTIVGALIIFAYQGAEVSESGWFIQYLISYRHGDPSRVGYVTSGFWAGITLGRFTLTHVARRVGERNFIYIMGVGAIAFQIMAWRIPDVIGDAVAVSILGLLLGPIYPCAATVFTRLLPGNLQTTSISFISSAGSSGGAIVPFITGLVAQKAGTAVLHPICIGAYVAMLGFLMILPRVSKRNE